MSHLAFEGFAKGAIATVATLLSQLLGTGRAFLSIETDEMIDAQIVDISIVSRTLIREILAKIETVGSNSLSKLEKGEIVL